MQADVIFSVFFPSQLSRKHAPRSPLSTFSRLIVKRSDQHVRWLISQPKTLPMNHDTSR